MEEIAPGLWHWTAPHDKIGVDVSSYYLERERVVLDPMTPPQGLDWFDAHGAPEHVLMTNRHHDRHAWRFRDEFGCTVHCVREGLHEVQARGPVEPFDFGDTLPGNAVVYAVGVICPDETALHLPDHRALACADGVVHYGGGLGFVPDQYIDDPKSTKAGLRKAYGRLLDLDFGLLLLAHGPPVLHGAKDALTRFASGG